MCVCVRMLRTSVANTRQPAVLCEVRGVRGMNSVSVCVCMYDITLQITRNKCVYASYIIGMYSILVRM